MNREHNLHMNNKILSDDDSDITEEDLDDIDEQVTMDNVATARKM